jgi:hypothetical protein
MAKFSFANVKRNLTGKNFKDLAIVVGSVLATEALPMAVQAIAGKDANGQPRIDASGPAWDLASGAVGVTVALGFDNKAAALGIATVKATKHAYIHLNPQIAKLTGTPLLPASRNSVVASGVNDELPAGMTTKPVMLPNGEQIMVNVKEDAFDGASTSQPSMGALPAPASMNDYSATPFSDYSATPFSDYSPTPFADNLNWMDRVAMGQVA